MAEQTVNLYAVKSAYLTEAEPVTPHPTNSTSVYQLTRDASFNDRKLIFGYEELPSNLKRKALIRAQFELYNHRGQYNRYDLSVTACPDFDANTATWENAGANLGNVGVFSKGDTTQPLNWANRLSDVYGEAGRGRSGLAKAFLATGCAAFLDGNGIQTGLAIDEIWEAKAVLANGTAPYATIVYDDAITIQSKPSWLVKLINYFDTSRAHTLSWALVSDNAQWRCADETWEQASAVFKWRYSGDNSWNEISVSGSTQEVTIPAYTFTSGSTVEYTITTTDTEGHSATTATATVIAAKTQVTATEGPTSGYKDPRTATTFDGYLAVEKWNYIYPQGSMSLFWKVSTDANYTEVAFTNLETPVVIAANTFQAASTINWYLSGTDQTGYASTTPVYSFSTAAGTATAVAQSPIGSAEDGSAPIEFKWLLTSSDGQTPSAVDLWWKLPTESSSSFHPLLSQASARTSYTAPAGTFSAGEIQWVVRAYNIDGTAGPWSTPDSGYYSFLCVSAPAAPEGLTTDNMPFLTVSWQSAEQQAYEIKIDGKIVASAFGADVYSWTSPDWLEDGAHEISVRVQGAFGLWSQPATVACVISNQSSDALILSGDFDTDAGLEWSTGSARTDFLIYRDGVRIGHTAQNSFADRTVLGEHDWTVINRLADGNYDKSNTIRATLETDVSLIADLSDAGSSWIRLRLSERSAGVQMFQKSRTHSLRHFSGASYPVLELSPFTDLTASYDTAFMPEDPAAEELEALFGKPVVLKSRRGNVMIGALVRLSKSVEDFYNVYSFTLQRIHWEDFIDEAGD